MPDLYPYQKDGAAFLAERRRAMLLDEPGLGKTPQAIVACDLIGAKRVLVIPPASVRTNWRREFDLFSTTAIVPVVDSYEMVAKDWRRYDGPWDVIIIDEGHYLKSPNAKRTLAIYGSSIEDKRADFPGLIGMSAHAWTLTGTPAPNNAAELHKHMWSLNRDSLRSAAYPDKVMGQLDFERRYCEKRMTKFGERVVGTKNHEELRERLSGWTLRRLKRGVLPDLPAITYQELLVDAPDAVAAMADVPGEQMDMLREVLAGGDATGLQSRVVSLAELRRITALAKMPVLAEWVKEFLASTDRKIVLFAHHREAIEGLHKALTPGHNPGYVTPAMIHGGTRTDQRQNAIDRFQNDEKTRIFIGQIQAAGTGITLTAASDLVFLEQSWVPAENAQAAQRIHRIGQKRGCAVRYLTLAGSIDEGVQRALARKTRDLERIFD